jgi:hypothetical protein
MIALSLLALVATHGAEPQAGKFPYFDASAPGGLIGGGTSWGVVLPENDHFARVCEEAYSNAEFDEVPSPPRALNSSFSHLRADGGVLIGGFGGTFITNDFGCTYEPVAFFAGQVTSTIARGPGGSLLLATATLSSDNGIYESTDDGDTWSELVPPVADVSFFQLVTNADASLILATGSNSASATVPAVFVSVDGGATFDDVSSGYAQYPLVRGATFDVDGAALLGGFDAQGKGMVLRALPPFDAPEELPVDLVADGVGDDDDPAVDDDFPSEITHVAVVPGGGGIVALARLRKVLFHRPAGAAAFVDVTEAATGPSDCVFVHPDGQRLIGCGQDLPTGAVGLFMQSTDGVTWSPTIDFGEVVYRRCPAGTVGHDACKGQFEADCGDGLDDDFDQLVDCDDDECAPLCGEGEGEAGEGEGEAGEGEGEPGEGEGEGEGEPPSCFHCASSSPVDISTAALIAMALAWLPGARRRRAGRSGR